MDDWTLHYEGFDPAQEGTREALCTLGNGYFGTRGAALEADSDGVHYPGTYIAGGFNRRRVEIGGRTVENESLVNMPNWLPVRFRPAGGEWFRLDRVRVLHYRQELDFHEGVLHRRVSFEFPDGKRCRLSERRLVHIGEPHLGALEVMITADNWSGEIELRSALDGNIINGNVPRYGALEGHHLDLLTAESPRSDVLLLKMQTRQSELRIAEAARTRLYLADAEAPALPVIGRDAACLHATYRLELQRGQPLTVEKTVALYSSRDDAISEPGLEAVEAVLAAERFAELHRRHTTIWRQLWKRFDVELDHRDPAEGERTERILRLHIFHLLQVASLHARDLDVGIPARGLHGEAYRGHIFWDELFIFPLLNLRLPEVTRSMLSYRYRRLDQARIAARDAGYRGAMYPWQSGSNGREESQRVHLNPKSSRWVPDYSWLQRHVNHAIAYNVWQYYQVTADIEFMSFYGAEMLLEIARFLASMASYDEAQERYEIRGVLGPDEFHDAYPGARAPGLNNNAYTNVLTVWVLARALELPQFLPAERWQELCEQLDLQPEEFSHWDAISRRMRVAFHDSHIISQFEGYERLEELDWEAYRRKYGDIHRLDRLLEAEGDDVNRYKASKQADVLMLFYLFSAEELEELFRRLGYSLQRAMIPANVRYYLARTSHGSTLSSVVHARVLARSNHADSWHLFAHALESDVADVQGGTTREGIHLGAMAGTVDLIQRAYTGLEVRRGVLWLDPALPADLRGLRLTIRYRGHTLRLTCGHEQLSIRSMTSGAAPIRIAFRSDARRLAGGETLTFACGAARCGPPSPS